MKLFRTTDTLLVCAIIAAAAFTYKAKHDAEGQMAALRKVEADIRTERETIDVLNADWSVFTQPARLQRLMEAFNEELGLKPLEATQIGTLAELPVRQVDIETLLNEIPDQQVRLPATVDRSSTASVRP